MALVSGLPSAITAHPSKQDTLLTDNEIRTAYRALPLDIATAIDANRLPGDVTGLVRDQPRASAGDIRRLALAEDRAGIDHRLPRQLLCPFERRLRHDRVHNEARGDVVTGDAERAELLGQGLGQRDDPPLEAE